jgi:hypothetical protein
MRVVFQNDEVVPHKLNLPCSIPVDSASCQITSSHLGLWTWQRRRGTSLSLNSSHKTETYGNQQLVVYKLKNGKIKDSFCI